MTLTEKQLYDYIYCPAYYDIKYNKKIDIQEHITFTKLLHTVANYFYLTIFNNNIASANKIKNKWDSVCEKNIEIINTKKNIDGMFLLNNLYRWAYDQQLYIIDINTQYKIVFDNVQLIGNMNPISVNKDNKIELLITSFSNKNPDQNFIDMNLKYTIDNYAFNTLFDRELDGIKVHAVKNNIDLFTNRNKEDFKRLHSTLKGVANGIKYESFYPREQILCNNCTAKYYCKYWFK